MRRFGYLFIGGSGSTTGGDRDADWHAWSEIESKRRCVSFYAAKLTKPQNTLALLDAGCESSHKHGYANLRSVLLHSATTLALALVHRSA